MQPARIETILPEQHRKRVSRVRMPKFKELFDDDEASASSSASSGAEESAEVASKKRRTQAQGPTLEALQDIGFHTGPSVLSIKEQAEEPDYAWGQAGRQSDGEEEDFEERERTRAAGTYGTDEAAKQAVQNRRQAALLREQERAEHAQAQQKRRETYQQREKRKRDLGQAKKGKNYVEEEKRLLRQHNVYSGFDT